MARGGFLSIALDVIGENSDEKKWLLKRVMKSRIRKILFLLLCLALIVKTIHYLRTALCHDNHSYHRWMNVAKVRILAFFVKSVAERLPFKENVGVENAVV